MAVSVTGWMRSRRHHRGRSRYHARLSACGEEHKEELMPRRRKRIWLSGGPKHPYCVDGTPDSDVCHNVSLLQARESDFHDQVLIDATRAINTILERAPMQPAPPNRPPNTHLALINTSLGLLLVWAEAIERPGDISEFITYRSPEEAIRDALGIEGESEASGAPSQGPTRAEC
jgi:hypothetical protein